MTIPALRRHPRASHNPRHARGGCPRRAFFGRFLLRILKEGPVVLAPFYRRACLVVVLSVIPASVLAQGTSAGAIAGVVRDSSGGVLPGVAVEASSPALIEKIRSTVTDEKG